MAAHLVVEIDGPPSLSPPAEPAAASRICTASRHLHRHYRMRRKRPAARRRPPSGGPQFNVKTLDRRNFVRATAFATLSSINRRPIVKVVLFLALSALAVVGYLFLLNVLNEKVGPFSAAVPAIFLALAAFALNWRFLKVEGTSLGEVGFDRPVLRFRQVAIGFVV